MTATLYAGNLGWAMTDDNLRDLFAPTGNVVTARIERHESTGRSRGFGYVEMESEAQARDAVAALNHARVGGLALIVREVAGLPRPAALASAGGERA